MQLGILTIELDIAHAMSLKDKRAVLNRVKERVRNKFNVSIAEVEDHDVWNVAVLAVVIVSNNQKSNNQVLDKVVDHIEKITDCDISHIDLDFMIV